MIADIYFRSTPKHPDPPTHRGVRVNKIGDGVVDYTIVRQVGRSSRRIVPLNRVWEIVVVQQERRAREDEAD